MHTHVHTLIHTRARTHAYVTSARAFGLQAHFRQKLLHNLARNHAAHFLWTASNRWFAARLDWLTTVIVLTVGMSILGFRHTLEPTLAALALTYVMQITSLFQWGFRMWAEMHNHFVSVERACGYTKLPQEPPTVLPSDRALADDGWPTRGALCFEGVEMRYRAELPLVLRSVDFALDGGVKCAIVGRSGAGKSSLSVALLRLAPLSGGAIYIDGVDISTLGLHSLRRAICFIQQDAILFSGSLRSNLDPFNEHSDAELEQALSEVDYARLSGNTEGAAFSAVEGGASLECQALSLRLRLRLSLSLSPSVSLSLSLSLSVTLTLALTLTN